MIGGGRLSRLTLSAVWTTRTAQHNSRPAILVLPRNVSYGGIGVRDNC